MLPLIPSLILSFEVITQEFQANDIHIQGREFLAMMEINITIRKDKRTLDVNLIAEVLAKKILQIKKLPDNFVDGITAGKRAAA
ncbi:MAG: hypothetical protein C0617_12145 [Desulfuromonas sp.]|nr:MAG: hypothetical protein C0617_12145 [Desulfuromonas sp.]